MTRVLVTGGCGFLGRALVPELSRRGSDVVAADNLSNPLSVAPPGYPFLELDMGDVDSARRAFEGTDACIALASAWGAVGYVHRVPGDILTENGRIAVATFRAAAEARIERLVWVSSSLVYERCTTFPTPESELETAPAPRAAFAVSKLLGESLCRAYFHQHGMRYTIIRPSNIYSAEEPPADRIGDTHVIPDLFGKLIAGQDPLELVGDGAQRRCFVHADDLARGVADALESEQAVNEDFNVAGDGDISILELARMIWETARPGEKPRIRTTAGFPGDLLRSYPDNAKAKRVLGWEPRVDFRSGLEEVYAGLRAQLAPDR